MCGIVALWRQQSILWVIFVSRVVLAYLPLQSLSQGIGLPGNRMYHFTTRGSMLSAYSETFTVCSPHQTSVQVSVFEGESTNATENFFLGSLNLQLRQPSYNGTEEHNVSRDVRVEFTNKDLWPEPRIFFKYVDILGREHVLLESSVVRVVTLLQVSVSALGVLPSTDSTVFAEFQLGYSITEDDIEDHLHHFQQRPHDPRRGPPNHIGPKRCLPATPIFLLPSP